MVFVLYYYVHVVMNLDNEKSDDDDPVFMNSRGRGSFHLVPIKQPYSNPSDDTAEEDEYDQENHNML